jgi:sugar phosphate isomerase/epimerase
MNFSRRDFGKFALGSIPVASAMLANPHRLFAAGGPNSLIAGVQVGVITYSFRSMPYQTAEATLSYICEAGLSATELMGDPVEAWAREKTGFTPSNAGGGRGGFGGFGGGRGGGGRGPGGAGAPGGAPAAAAAPADTRSWNGQPCPAGRGGGGPGGPGRAAGAAGGLGGPGGSVVAGVSGAPGAAAAAGGPGGPGAPGGGGGGRGAQTPEQIAAADELRKWREGQSMDIYKDLKKLYNDAGVSIYAVKNLQVNGTDEDLDFQFTVGKTLGASHLTAELPSGPDAPATLKRVGDFALKHGMFAAYHTHLQGSITAFDDAFAASKGNKANIDFGHYVAAGEIGGTPMDFLNKFHDRVASFHLKDRTKPEHCELNLAWGMGETPIKEILRLVRDNKWPIPATIELEYEIPEGSDAVKETAKCLQYCKDALTT